MSRESRERWAQTMTTGSVRIQPGPTPDTVKVELENPASITCPNCSALVPPPVMTTKVTDGCYSMLMPGDPRDHITLHLRSAIDLALAMAGATAVRINSEGPGTPRVTVEHNNIVDANLGELVDVEIQPSTPVTWV